MTVRFIPVLPADGVSGLATIHDAALLHSWKTLVDDFRRLASVVEAVGLHHLTDIIAEPQRAANCP